MKKVIYGLIFSLLCFAGINSVSASSDCYTDLPVTFGSFVFDTDGRVGINDNNSGGYIDVTNYRGKDVNIIYDVISTDSGSPRYHFGFTSAFPKYGTVIPTLVYGLSQIPQTYHISIPTEASYLILVGVNSSFDNHDWIKYVHVSLTEEYCPPGSVANMSKVLNSGINPLSFLGTFKTLLPWVITLTIAFLAIYLLKRALTGYSNANPKF